MAGVLGRISTIFKAKMNSALDAAENPSETLDLSYEQTLVNTPSALLDHLNLVLCGGNMPQATRDRITTALTALPASTTALERAQTAVLLVTTSAAGATQK